VREKVCFNWVLNLAKIKSQRLFNGINIQQYSMGCRLQNASVQIFFCAKSAEEKEKREKGLLPTGVSKSAVHTVL
jgi:hypothetical protein